MEEQIRKIVREEIARALGAMSDVADSAASAYTEPGERFSLQALRGVTRRVARDVLADLHPAAGAEHTASTPDRDLADPCTCGHDFYRHREGACFACTCPRFHPVPVSTPVVHTITVVPERPRAACTCSRHVHVMGNGDLCGHPGCFCRTPVRAQAEHAEARVHVSEHIAGTEVPRTCSVCLHGEHDQGKCTMHVYVKGVARPCPCLASRTVRSIRAQRASTSEHTGHGAGVRA